MKTNPGKFQKQILGVFSLLSLTSTIAGKELGEKETRAWGQHQWGVKGWPDRLCPPLMLAQAVTAHPPPPGDDGQGPGKQV